MSKPQISVGSRALPFVRCITFLLSVSIFFPTISLGTLLCESAFEPADPFAAVELRAFLNSLSPGAYIDQTMARLGRLPTPDEFKEEVERHRPMTSQALMAGLHGPRESPRSRWYDPMGFDGFSQGSYEALARTGLRAYRLVLSGLDKVSPLSKIQSDFFGRTIESELPLLLERDENLSKVLQTLEERFRIVNELRADKWPSSRVKAMARIYRAAVIDVYLWASARRRADTRGDGSRWPDLSETTSSYIDQSVLWPALPGLSLVDVRTVTAYERIKSAYSHVLSPSELALFARQNAVDNTDTEMLILHMKDRNDPVRLRENILKRQERMPPADLSPKEISRLLGLP